MQLPVIGQPLRIRIHHDKEQYFRTRLLDVLPNGLLIDAPLSERIADVFKPGVNFTVEFHANDGLYRFQSKLLSGGTVTETPPSWVIERPAPNGINREQRRQFVRVETDIPVRIEFTQNGSNCTLEVRSRDLSGGGISLSLPKQTGLKVGTDLVCRFVIPKSDFPVEAQGILLRLENREDMESVIGSVAFVRLHSSIQQKIVQFTFWRQQFLSGLIEKKTPHTSSSYSVPRRKKIHQRP